MEKKNKSFFQWLQSLLKPTGEQSNSEKKLTKYHYAILVGIVGITFMLFSNSFINSSSSNKQEDLAVFNQEKENEPAFNQKEDDTARLLQEIENQYESDLKEVLQTIVGVDEVEIMINLDATEAKVYEKNTITHTQITDETDREGGRRKVEDTSKDEQLVIIRNGDTENPVVVKVKKPEVRGVLVSAKGADNIQVKKWIIEAVTRVLDVPSHRVSVLPKKNPKGES
ncbi:stage III sporulation protein AG [Bacillus salitolerans]|uniref:Stage III sporulation protein AG n=1 Tax=Bacillus salitolerans TaxID=1437434 RepID=A0ABW4LN07_9BACI